MISLHVVGCPRSGTTLLTEMIAACFDIDGSCVHEESIFKVSPDHHGIYLSKKPNDILWVKRLIEHDKQLHVIALIRDPRAVICSIHDGHPGIYFCNYPVWKRAEKALSKLQGHPRVLVLHYEELVTTPNTVQQKIAAQFPFLHTKNHFSDFHLHAISSSKSIAALGGVRQVSEDSIQGWRNHLPRVHQQIKKYPALLNDLKKYGYEKDDTWLTVLKDVPIKNFPCRYSDKSEFFKYLEQYIRFNTKIKRYLAARKL